MNLKHEISSIKNLNKSDMDLLYEWSDNGWGAIQANLHTLSIFKTCPPSQFLNDYKFSLYSGEPIFYCGFYNKGNLSIFFDVNKKIIFNSRFYLTHLDSFFKNIDACLHHLDKVNFSSLIEIYSPVVAIEKWFISYGHFKDEAYNLGEILSDTSIPQNAIALLDYPTDERLNHASFSFSSNYQKIEKLIFESRSLNAYNFKAHVLKFSEVFVFENRYLSKTFHSFPMTVSSRIKNNIIKKNKTSEFLFLTRSSSYRDIDNKTEIEEFLKQKFNIFSPENNSYDSLVEHCDAAKLIVMYYGSAMTNMCYFKPNTNVIILKSKSYAPEKIDLWNTLISNYSLKLTIIDADESNFINQEHLMNAINQCN